VSWRSRREDRQQRKAYDAHHARLMGEKVGERDPAPVEHTEEASPDKSSREDQEEAP
jgi:hypothetical protein